MKLVVAAAISFMIMVSLPSCGQSLDSETVLGAKHAKEQVRIALLSVKQSDKAYGNSILYVGKPSNSKVLLAKKEVAIAVAEPILFDIYGKENIVKQRPYEIHLVDGFWYITGTLPKDYDGGTFEIILDANTSRVLAVSHGK